MSHQSGVNLSLILLSLAAAPTSFEGPFGKVTYRVVASIDTPRFSKDYKATKPFYLLNLLNLNEVPDIEVGLCLHPVSSADRLWFGPTVLDVSFP